MWKHGYQVSVIPTILQRLWWTYSYLFFRKVNRDTIPSWVSLKSQIFKLFWSVKQNERFECRDFCAIRDFLLPSRNQSFRSEFYSAFHGALYHYYCHGKVDGKQVKVCYNDAVIYLRPVNKVYFMAGFACNHFQSSDLVMQSRLYEFQKMPGVYTQISPKICWEACTHMPIDVLLNSVIDCDEKLLATAVPGR